jgi:hypothetical protein
VACLVGPDKNTFTGAVDQLLFTFRVQAILLYVVVVYGLIIDVLL